MPSYRYHATDRGGRAVSGQIDAPDEPSVRARLEDSRYAVTLILPVETPSPAVHAGAGSIARPLRSEMVASPAHTGTREFLEGYTPPEPVSAGPAPHIPISPAATVPVKQLAIFYRKLGTLVRSGVPIVAALSQLREQTRNKTLREAVADMESAVSSGRPMSDAMDRHPRAFRRGHAGMLRVGEGTGRLAQTLETLAGQMDADWKVETSLRYNPMLLIVRWVMAPIIAILFLGVLPDVFNPPDWGPQGATLMATNAVILLSFVALVGVIFFPIIISGLRWTPVGPWIDEMLFSVPFLGARRNRVERERVIGSLCAALDAGIAPGSAWEMASDAPESRRYRRAMTSPLRSILRGIPISEALEATGLFDEQLLQTARMGEMSGDLPAALAHGISYDQEERRKIDALTPWVLATLAYFLYLIVGTFVVIHKGIPVYMH